MLKVRENPNKSWNFCIMGNRNVLFIKVLYI